MLRNVQLATCSALPDGDPDDAPLILALEHVGVRARFVAWDDPELDPSVPVVLRSTWDYTLHRDRFLSWVCDLATVFNTAEVVLWNSDKVYLHDLAEAGVPVTPTQVVRPGAPVEIPPGEVVVKPSVGAGSRGAGRFADPAAAVGHVDLLHGAGRTALVQPYLAGVDEAGETALVYLDGVFSHAIRKGPMLGGGTVHELDESRGLYVEEDISPREPTPAELAVGARAVTELGRRFGGTLLYARIDLLPGPDGPVVVEVELTEPSLFLAHADGAVARMAAAIAGRV